MEAEFISVTDYAKIIGITTQGVRKAIKENRSLPGVIETKKVGGVWILKYQA